MGSKSLHQQNPPVLNWSCRLTQVNLYSGCKSGGQLVWFVVKVCVDESIAVCNASVNGQLCNKQNYIVLQPTEHLLSPKHTHARTHTYTFNCTLSRTTQVNRYEKGKTNLDFTEARDSEWQWHLLGHMQVCTSLQTDDLASTPPLLLPKQ